MSKIQASIIINTKFDTQDELNSWVNAVTEWHREQYGTSALSEALLKDRAYKGKLTTASLIVNNEGLTG